MKYLASFLLLIFTGLTISAQTLIDLEQYNESPSRFRGVIEKFSQDRGSIDRFFTARTSPNRILRLQRLYSDWQKFLERQNFESLNQEEQIDYLLFKNYLKHKQHELVRYSALLEEMEHLLPFMETISDLEDARRMLKPINAAKTADLLNNLNKQILSTQAKLNENKKVGAKVIKPTTANRTAETLRVLREVLSNWFHFHDGYNPKFSWWNKKPYEVVKTSLDRYRRFLLEKLVGIKPNDTTTIIGDPIGRQALLSELEYEMIPYTPEELVQIANREFAWCEAEMKKASREMGFGDDWKKALEAVKNKYVEPGRQPELIRDQAYEAIDFLEKNDLVTIPRLMKESWRMEMMSPARQLVSPFFLGGETIIVSYPTDTMTHEQKLMSMRGNNPHFTHAVTHHELIPGHHMQGYMTKRYRPYRKLFYTPFWMEGWALYWEFLLWDMNFNKTPEDRVGALFWRMHRCARIIFSLSFHLEKMSPDEAVDFLVNRVGHERANATAEVRRSFAGNYGPLYQIAYMVGGLQFYNLHRELVGSTKMTNREFHDAILKEGAVPVELVRAILTKQKMTPDYKAKWRFYKGLDSRP